MTNNESQKQSGELQVDSALREGQLSLSPPEACSSQLTPEMVKWARLQFTEAEVLSNLQEIRAEGGLELTEFLQTLEQMAEQ